MISISVGSIERATVNAKTDGVVINVKDGETAGVSVPAVSSDECTVKSDSTIVAVSTAPAYSGTYEITPSAEQQTMVTKNLRMLNNVTIKEIPYHRVSNSLGDTVIIA